MANSNHNYGNGQNRSGDFIPGDSDPKCQFYKKVEPYLYKFPEKERESFKLHCRDGLSQREVATRRNVTVPTVSRQVSAAFRRGEAILRGQL